MQHSLPPDNLQAIMPDKYRITELISTHSSNEISAKLKFEGILVYPGSVGEALINGLDTAMNAELSGGAAIFQTINNHWRLSISQQTVCTSFLSIASIC